jgi:hypothetical protein
VAADNARSEKLTDLLTNQIGTGIRQFVGATGLSYLARATTSWAALVGIPALMTVDYIIEKRHEHSLYRFITNVFSDELVQLTGISKSDLTPEKVKEVLTAHRGDPRFAVFSEVQSLYEQNKHNKLMLSFFSATITVGGILAGAAFGGSALGIAFLVGTGSTLIAGVLNTYFKVNAEEADSRSVYVQIKELRQQAATQQVQPAKVLQVFLKAQPNMQAQVQQQFGKSYDEMSLGEKRQVVALYDKALHINELTAKINSGSMRPTEIAWIVYGQRTGVPERVVSVTPTQQDVHEQGNMRADFVSRLQAEKLEQKADAPTLH